MIDMRVNSELCNRFLLVKSQTEISNYNVVGKGCVTILQIQRWVGASYVHDQFNDITMTAPAFDPWH